MPSWIHGRNLACVALLMGVSTALAGCGTPPARARTTLPFAFVDPARFPDFSSSVDRASIERRLRKSQCAAIDSDVAGLAFAGLSTQPETAGGIVLDTGSTPEGTTWFLHRDADDRDVTFCGVALVGADTGTKVSVTGVRQGDMAQVKAAVESGDFFCTCRRLAK